LRAKNSHPPKGDHGGRPGRGLVLALAVLFLLMALGGNGWTALGQGQGPGDSPPEPFRLLIVDETQTFGSSIRLQVLASLLNRTGLFELTAKFVQVESSFDDPLQGEEPDRRYDAILIIPKGVDDGTVRQLWVVTRAWTELPEALRSAIGQLKAMANEVFQGTATAVDVTEDLIPAYFATLFTREGWL
jgi:hypothetical protein